MVDAATGKFQEWQESDALSQARKTTGGSDIAFSPDGKQIAFTASAAPIQNPAGKPAKARAGLSVLYTANADGSALRQIAP